MTEKELTPEQFRRKMLDLSREVLAREREGIEGYAVFAEFERVVNGDWFETGQVAGELVATAKDAELQLEGNGPPVKKLRGAGVARSDLAGTRAHGVLRSPTFRIERNNIYFHVAGKGARANLIIDGFQQIRDPIYGGLTFAIDHGDQLRWHRMDVSMWRGHRAYVEFLDEGDGWFGVHQVWFGDKANPPRYPPGIPGPIENESFDTPAKLAGRYAEYLREKVSHWKGGLLDQLHPTRRFTEMVNQLLACEPLWLGPRKLTKEQQLDLTKAAELEQAAKQLEAKLPAPTYVMAMADGSGENEAVFIRGNHKTPGDEVPRRFLEAISGKDQPAQVVGSGRLELARRLASADNPLTARVMVNRLWHHHFGSGIVKSVDDFGVQGTGPTHPELLDWLAAEIVRQGWSLKKMHRLMVLSSTYRQASRADAKADELDPENKLLHRMPIRRLEAEAIRDAILSASGRLDRKLYGPSVMPHLTPHMQGRGRPGSSGPLDGDGRRSLYVNVRRNFLTPLFLAFDYPVPFTTIGRRTVSNVPAQALAMMNNPFVRQQAELWAKRVLAEKKPTKERIADLYETAFGRLPTDGELGDALGFIEAQGDNLAGWTELCHVLFNVKEFIFVN